VTWIFAQDKKFSVNIEKRMVGVEKQDGHNLRVVLIKDQEDAKKALVEVGTDQPGSRWMAPKAVHRVIRIKNLNSKAAVILKQEMLSLVLSKMGAIINLFRDLTHKAQVDELYLVTLLKILGIAYIAEFGAQICRDAGEGTIASKIELAGKILILLLALPIFTAVLQVVVRLLP
jgi:stage III sporulation protein AD